jgi:hypothetical protein
VAAETIVQDVDATERRWLGHQIASILAALPAAQSELAARSQRVDLPKLEELVRQVALLENVVLEVARD